MSDEPRTLPRRTPRSRPHRILVLALDGVSAMDLGVPVQVFGRESNAATDRTRAEAAPRSQPNLGAEEAPAVPGRRPTAVPAGAWPYEVEVCGITAGKVTGSDGLDYSVNRGLEALETADTVILPGATSAVADEPPAAVIGALPRHSNAARGSPRSPPAPLSSHAQVCSLGDEPQRTGRQRRSWPDGSPRSKSTRTSSSSTKDSC